MSTEIYDQRIASTTAVIAPAVIVEQMPCTDTVAALVNQTRRNVHRILRQLDDRLLVIVGPCSIHDPAAALEYGEKLNKLRQRLSGELEIVMRVYFEKPRTTVGWKGLINDPDLDESFHINKGLSLARELLLNLNAMGLPAGSEFLDIVTGQYYSDLISWGAIGARTTESQVHRELASGLSCPVGFKNGTDGNLRIALDAVKSAQQPHIFLSPTASGTTAIYKTTGNDDAHIILRGGQSPNYDAQSVKQAIQSQQQRDIDCGLIIDFSHANSAKQYQRQQQVGIDVAAQIASGQSKIAGVMIESHLVEGRQDVQPGQPLRYGQSITDACLGWADTEQTLDLLAQSVRQRRA